MTNTNIRANSLDLKYISWKSYNTIKKKAMEQKFSWSGLLISLSIAFFIVIACAQALSLMHQSIIKTQNYQQQLNNQMYRLESTNNYLHKKYISSDKIEYLPQLNLA